MFEEEDRAFFSKDELLNIIEKERAYFYRDLPFFIENHTPYKIVPYIYSKELLELTESSFKILKDNINLFCVPYEEKSGKFDYAVYSTSLINEDARFLQKIFYYDNLLDKRCLERWFVLTARLFSRTFRDIFVKIAKGYGLNSPALYLFLLTLIQLFREKRRELCSLNLGKVPPARKELYFSNLLFFFGRLILELFASELKGDTLPARFNIKLFSPLILYENRGVFLINPFNYWDITKPLFELLERAGIYNMSDIRNLNITREIYNEAVFTVRLKKLRETFYDFIARNYTEDEFMEKLTSAYYTPAFFINLLKNEDARGELNRLKKVSRLYQLKEKKDILLSFLEQVDKIADGSLVEKNQDVVKSAINIYITLKNHELYGNHIHLILKELRDRRKEETADLKKEYEEGRLYYFAADKSEILKEAEKRNCAAVFIDIREFSKKTFHLKEEAVLELLKEKFYIPVLRYAGKRKESGDIKLANIVGDAIVFLGPVDEIIKLSLLVKKHLNDYKEGLEHLVQDDEKKELMSIDIGIFIAFGTVPVMTQINSEFGLHHLFIGEIINIASRGSRRESEAIKRIEYMVSAEGKKRGIMFKLPFDLNIVDGYQLTMPPTVEYKLLKLEEFRVREAMEQFFEQARADMFLKDDGEEKIWSKRKYIYNVGIGLSEEALMEFIKQQKPFSDIKRVTVNYEKFSEEIKKKYFFRRDRFEFVFVKNKNSGEKFIFRREGVITFKGIYKEIVVWELLTEHQEIYPEVLSLIGNV